MDPIYWPGLVLSAISMLALVGIFLYSMWMLLSDLPWKKWYRYIKWTICRIFGHRKPWVNWMDDRLEEPAFAGCDFCGAHNVPRSGRSGL